MKRIYISDQEHIALIKATTEQGESIATSFGGNRVWLGRDDKGQIVSKWALPILAKMRGLSVEEGAGI